MDFFAVKLFLALYYIRPHEWIGWVGALHPILLTVAIAIFALFRRKEGFNKSELLKTPHDWMMLAYFVWFVGSNSNPLEVFLAINNVFAFYWITVLTLTSLDRMLKFLTWWNTMILVVAAMAVASEFGFDLLDSASLTNGKMLGRLALNTSIFNNPNALGHSVVCAVAMLYFIGFWNRQFISKIFTSILEILPLTCIFLTASKGAFLSGFATIVTALTFRRSWTMKILICTLAGTIGWVGLKTLPRMQELDTSTKRNEAISGRVAAFQFGLRAMHSSLRGIGYNNFEDRFMEEYHYPKTAHSSYVEAGAELGEPGLYLFLGVIYCCYRTLLTAKTVTEEEERIRRLLFCLLISYTVSSWMICWTYRASFFLMAAAIAAFHRQMLKHNQPAPAPANITGMEIQMAVPAGIPTTAVLAMPVGPPAVATATLSTPDSLTRTVVTGMIRPREKTAPPQTAGIQWNRISLADLGLILLTTCAVIQIWQYSMNVMHE
jgi:hypothetical protein